jgi:hypothetical protein
LSSDAHYIWHGRARALNAPGRTRKRRIARPLRIHHYDPAIPQWSAPPEPCRFVACIDVLEHIEPGLLDIRKRASWWLPKLTERFELAAFNRMP